MVHKIFWIFLFLVGVINFVPLAGILSAGHLAAAYGIELNDPELIILMRHRALLFGLLGGLVFYSLFKPQIQIVAMVLVGISMTGFMLLAWPVNDLNTEMSRVFTIDVIGLICLVLAACCRWLSQQKHQPIHR